ncbi:MAG: hypothetical protein EA360_03700 [Balneolaceae bacterium]|nr:MAG: hypothetical protein EA360_03700 [Balneolaceae bacterium]
MLKMLNRLFEIILLLNMSSDSHENVSAKGLFNWSCYYHQNASFRRYKANPFSIYFKIKKVG